MVIIESMKKIVVIMLCFILFSGFSFGKKKHAAQENEAGYRGSLPDIQEEFDYKKTKTGSEAPFNTDSSRSFNKLKPAPLEDLKYLEVIKKKQKPTSYTADMIEVKKVLAKLQNTLIKDGSIQVFNAQVSSLIDHAAYIEEKYKNKPERYSASYINVLQTSQAARELAMLRMNAMTYGKYVSYNKEGYIYSPRNIQTQMHYLLQLVNTTISVINQN